MLRLMGSPTPVFLPGKSHGQRNLVGYSPKAYKEPDVTEWLSAHKVWASARLLY